VSKWPLQVNFTIRQLALGRLLRRLAACTQALATGTKAACLRALVASVNLRLPVATWDSRRVRDSKASLPSAVVTVASRARSPSNETNRRTSFWPSQSASSRNTDPWTCPKVLLSARARWSVISCLSSAWEDSRHHFLSSLYEVQMVYHWIPRSQWHFCGVTRNHRRASWSC